MGSIPARAGEPHRCRAGTVPEGVYPRPCGGASTPISGRMIHVGLSPPVRGSHQHPRVGFLDVGSIPARAGEPGGGHFFKLVQLVYPRPCGGANVGPSHTADYVGLSPPCGGAWIWGEPPPPPAGLSPPVRGSLDVNVARLRNKRSIPARAGEPSAASWLPVHRRVYPRPCGGAADPDR